MQVGAGQHKPQAFAIYRLAISDYVATIAGTTRIKGIKHIMAASWLDGALLSFPTESEGFEFRISVFGDIRKVAGLRAKLRRWKVRQL